MKRFLLRETCGVGITYLLLLLFFFGGGVCKNYLVSMLLLFDSFQVFLLEDLSGGPNNARSMVSCFWERFRSDHPSKNGFDSTMQPNKRGQAACKLYT